MAADMCLYNSKYSGDFASNMCVNCQKVGKYLLADEKCFTYRLGRFIHNHLQIRMSIIP